MNMAHNCIVVNLDRCTGCFGCEVACKMENGVALGERWSKVLTVGPVGEYPDMTRYALPTGASYRDTDNVVLVNKEQCIGCKYCMMACPYGVRSWNEAEGCVEKCTLCGHLTSQGKQPACVKSCAAGARFYGDLDDPNSEVSKELAKYDEKDIHVLRDAGNKPATRYIMTEKIGTWYDRVEPRGGHQTAAYPVED